VAEQWHSKEVEGRTTPGGSQEQAAKIGEITVKMG